MYGYDPWAVPPTDRPAWSFAVRTPVSLSDLPAFVRPDGDPGAAPRELPAPPGSPRRVDQRFPEDELVWGTLYDDGEPALALRVDGTTFERGGTATVVLANVRRRRFEVEYESVGTRGKYDLQVYTDAGWQEVRASRGGERDEGVLLSPGRGYRWALELRETDGDLYDRAGDERFPLRAALPAGRYRFVYWGCEEPLAVAFDLVG